MYGMTGGGRLQVSPPVEADACHDGVAVVLLPQCDDVQGVARDYRDDRFRGTGRHQLIRSGMATLTGLAPETLTRAIGTSGIQDAASAATVAKPVTRPLMVTKNVTAVRRII